jgi:hypothetical protein
MQILHIYSDGSKLYKMSARALSKIPIWRGNRIIDDTHVKNIKDAIKDNIQLLDSGYKIIQYQEFDENNKITKKNYIIDGQHRIKIVNDYFENSNNDYDFEVTITEICVDSESDAITYFNKINNVKPIQFEEDPNMIINKYIKGLEDSYPSKLKLFRKGITRRPFLSIDKFREALKKRVNILKKYTVEEFVSECKSMNIILIVELEIRSVNEKDKEINIIHKSIELNFALAWDDKFKWLDSILN